MKLSSSAIIAGITLLIMAMIAPYAELFVYPKLVILNNAEQTTANIESHELLFASCCLVI